MAGALLMQVKTRRSFLSEFFNPPSIGLLPPPPQLLHTYTHTHSHTHFYTPYHLVLEMSTRGEIRGSAVHRGSLSWYARLVILQSPFLIIWWAPVCHLPVHSVCPKLWLPPQSVFYDDILASRGTLATASMHPQGKALCWCLTVWCMLTYLTSSSSWYVDKGLWIRPTTASKCKLHHPNLINILNFLTKFTHRVSSIAFQLFTVSLWRICVIKH